MSHYKLPAVRHALQVLRTASASGRSVLVMAEVEALEAMANNQAELVKALEMLEGVAIQLVPYPPEVAEGVLAVIDIAHAAIAKARGGE